MPCSTGATMTFGNRLKIVARVHERDALADRRDEARAVGHADVHGTLAQQRDELRVVVVLERHIEASIVVVAGLLGEVELRELDARDVAEPDRQARRLGQRGWRRG